MGGALKRWEGKMCPPYDYDPDHDPEKGLRIIANVLIVFAIAVMVLTACAVAWGA